jgi:hypothetical protein
MDANPVFSYCRGEQLKINKKRECGNNEVSKLHKLDV